MAIVQRAAAYTDRWVDRIVCTLGAVALAQGPEFMQQYLQRLGGHLDEARRILTQLLATASHSGQDPLVWAEKARTSSDAVIADLGRLVLTTQQRVDDLAQAQQALQSASAWERPWTFLAHLDSSIFRGTWHDFRPAVPTTGEGALYAITGMLLAWALYSGVAKPALLRVFRRRAATR